MKFESRESSPEDRRRTFENANCYNIYQFGEKDRIAKELLWGKVYQREQELAQLGKFREPTPLKATIEAIKEEPTPFRDTLNTITGKEPSIQPTQLEAKTGKTVADRYREAMERHHEREQRPTREYNFNKEP